MNHPLDKLDSRFIPSVNEELTFPGVIIEYFDEMATKYGWDSNTQLKYVYRFNQIVRILCPNNHFLPIRSYKEEHYKRVVSVIRKQRNRRHTLYTNSDINHYMYLMCVVTRTAENHIEGYEDCLWGSSLSATARGRKNEEILSCEFRSFTPEQEVVIFHRLTDSPESMSGEEWGLCLGYSDGCRNNESVATVFRDALLPRPIPLLYIYESESSKSGEIESSTKTKNGNRPVPTPHKIHENLKIRFKYVVRYVADHIEEYQRRISLMSPDKQAYFPELRPDTIEEFCMYLPIACKGTDYLVPTTSRRLTEAGKSFFKNIDFDEDIFYYAEIKSAEEESENNIKVHDPSTYLFRRNYFSHAYKCLMALLPGPHKIHPIAALQFIGGHKIEFGIYTRRQMQNEEIIQAIYQALLSRPLVNPIPSKTLPIISGQSMFEHQLLYNERLQIEGRVGEKIIMSIITNEPNDKTTIHFSMQTEGKIKAEIYTQSQSCLSDYYVNILKDYHSAFLEADRRYLLSNNLNNQEEIQND